MSTARTVPRSHTWLRVLVLLLALLVPGAHAQAHAVPAVAGVSGEAVEHDALDTVLRPPARTDRRTTVRLCSTPPSKPVPGVPARLSHPAQPRPPYVPHILRTVVLRC
ncbi:hypothetical protein SAMN04487981_13841 [Streptomyces sp. cf386]|uniref:hypothetical protein n=1 Tax=Streptomyces sp. cf386 TaxID=1761904 RepID=UPI000883B002|nr:hypothetical protein [Streptomyces sp. cf386]SDP76376.1 hypothetical protein SAMN04487981_13841 [Streptomyces sp. cf386]